jgi:hypothetical protein
LARASACHAEGRGFESLQPLSRRPAFAGLFAFLDRSSSARLGKIVNLDEWAWHVIDALRQEALRNPDERLEALIAELEELVS